MFDRKNDVAKRPSKKPCHASSKSCTSSVVSSPNVWADLLDCLLHQIIALLSSSNDIIAFAATCRSWRAAFTSFPSTLSCNVPPLCLQSHIHYPHRGHSRIKYSLLYNCEWQLTDAVKRSSSCRLSPPHNHPNRMHYLGCSYGNLIFSNSNQCLLVDVFGFTTVRPPKLKSTGKHEIYYGILDGSLKSPNLHLFLCSGSSIFQWQVGSNSWLEHPLDIPSIFRIVFFKGEMFARDQLDGLHTIRLAPQLSIHEVDIDWTEYWREDSVVGRNVMYWLVVCGDMFLMVDLSMSTDRPTVFFRVFRLDFSIVPPKWVKVENLGNHAIFVSFDQRNPAFCCTDPERWGGKSNCIYVATQSKKNDKPWTVVELGQAVSSRNWRPVAYPYGNPGQPDNLWVFPSLVYDVEL